MQIGYASIQKIRLTKVRNQRSLVISGNGRAITLAEASFRTRSDFDRFLEELQARLDR